MKNILLTTVLLSSALPVFAQKGLKINAGDTDMNVSNVAMLYGKREKVVKLQQQTNFSIKGKINGQKEGVLHLSYALSDGKFVQDSAAIKNGTFEFKGKLTEPATAYFTGAVKSRNMDDPNFVSFFIEPAEMYLTVTAGDFKNFKLTGSRTQDEGYALDKLKEPIRKEMQPLSIAYQKANEAYTKAIRDKKPEEELKVLKEKAADLHEEFGPYNARMDKIDYNFISKHPDSYVTAFLMRFKISSLPADSAKMIYNSWTDRIKQSNYGKEVAGEIAKLQNGSPGSMATNFSVKDINGEQLSLADFKGKKYVLLDFWASWCVPCRKSNPHLKTLYSKYKDKGLEIVAISDDDNAPDAWKKAVAEDGTGIWKHVLRGLKRTATGYDKSTDISEPFGIHSLPTKILIDKNGMIIGRYGGGGENDEAMDKKLAEVFE